MDQTREHSKPHNKEESFTISQIDKLLMLLHIFCLQVLLLLYGV